MQLAFTILGCSHTSIIAEILPTVSDCLCNILELRYSQLNNYNVGYLLVEGNWNQIAKLEHTLETISKRLNIRIRTMRQEKQAENDDFLPYSLETISTDRENLIRCITDFLLERNIIIHEISGSQYQSSYIQTPVFSLKFIIFVPPDLRLLSLREEFLDFCDQLNIDAILEPIKR